MTFPQVTIEGYPRVGAHRELKKALEAYWAGRIDEAEFTTQAHELRLANYDKLKNLGLTEDYAIPADVAYYDQVLETALTTGFLQAKDLTEEFTLARGNAQTAPLEMTKWFDSNYHYLVPEIADQAFTPNPERIVAIFEEARAAGHTIRPYLVGPITVLTLAKGDDRFSRAADLAAAYATVLEALDAAGAQWVQLAEPALVADHDLPDGELAALTSQVYGTLLSAKKRPQVLVTSPFGALHAGLEALAEAAPEALHVDLSPATLRAEPDYPARVAAAVRPETVLVAGLIDGRNIWRANLTERAQVLDTLREKHDNVAISTTTSLLHVPHTLELESNIPAEVKPWLAFADEKIGELVALHTRDKDAFARADQVVRDRAESTLTTNREVQDRVAGLTSQGVQRQPAFDERKKAQQEKLHLPTLPTTTIGSFPQTQEIRQARKEFRAGEITEEQYTERLKKEVADVIALQEKLGIDVLVHGEPERNDMVQYFAELLDGFISTENAWVQSYGSRCVRPPIIYGDVSRPAAMTTEWSGYAQSLTNKPVKGMLTGPVTILAWSFKRDDISWAESANQIAVALADEVRDLEAANIDIIQIDEPALRELLPLRADKQKEYLDWSVQSFRLVAVEAKPTTQIHTHLCYSEFGEIIDAIAGLDADVTSIEAARSNMELLTDLNDNFHSDIGPGVWDIHSPRIPSVEELVTLIKAALRHVPAERLWVNPDCGLKTRGYAETTASLENLVAARNQVAEQL